MLQALEVITVLLLAIVVTQSLAHALEYPGKMRLSKEQYLAVQPIYYPGFTFGGVAEPLSIVALAVLAMLEPGGARRWLTVGALAALVAAHIAYWLITHPVNNFWLRETELKGAGKSFFGSDPLRRGKAEAPEWTELRDRWERSHVLRAVLSFAGLAMFATAVSL